MRIFGAGMAGLVAANMLRRYQPVVFEAQDKLPDNHGALLRFRSDRVANAVGQKFKKVEVRKAIVAQDKIWTECDPQLANLYSYKVNGKVESRSIWDLAPVTRWIAPDDFLEVMARGIDLRLKHPIDGIDLMSEENRKALPGDGPIISTIPMPVMMDITGWTYRPYFPARSITTLTATLPEWVDVYQTLYYPELNKWWYRASITGQTLTIEGIAPDPETPLALSPARAINQVLHDFGIPDVSSGDLSVQTRPQAFGKLSPIPEEIRRAFILWLTNEYGIYSVGRFATWRQILLDDVVNDIQVVESMIGRDAYARTLQHNK